MKSIVARFTDPSTKTRVSALSLLALRASPAMVRQAADSKAVMEARRIAAFEGTCKFSCVRVKFVPPGTQGGLSSTA